MDALGVNLWDADVRASIEALQWGVAQDLMRLGTSVIIEWDTWGREERDVLREGAPDSWTLPSSCTTSTFQPTSCGGESKRGTWRTRRGNESLSTKHVESFQTPARSDERRVVKECGSPWRSRVG